MKSSLVLVAFAVCLVLSSSGVDASRRKLAQASEPAKPAAPAAPAAPAVSATAGPYGTGNSGNYNNNNNNVYPAPGFNNHPNNQAPSEIPGFDQGFLGESDNGKRGNQTPGLIKVNSAATVDVETDNLKICAAVREAKYASGYEPNGKYYSTDAATDATNSAESFATYKKPVEAELKYILKELEKSVAKKLEKIVDFLSDNKAKHLTSEGIRFDPIYDYGCWSKLGCNYADPTIIGYQAHAQLCFEVPAFKADDLIKSCVANYDAIMLEITFAASEDRLLKGEQEAIKRAVFEAARKASTVGKALAQLNEESEFDQKYFDEKNFGYEYGGYGNAYSTGLGQQGNNKGQQAQSRFGFDLELVAISCQTKENEYMKPFYQAPFYSNGHMMNVASYSNGGYNNYDDYYNKERDFSSYTKAEGIVEQVDVACNLVTRINGQSGNNKFGQASHGAFAAAGPY